MGGGDRESEAGCARLRWTIGSSEDYHCQTKGHMVPRFRDALRVGFLSRQGVRHGLAMAACRGCSVLLRDESG